MKSKKKILVIFSASLICLVWLFMGFDILPSNYEVEGEQDILMYDNSKPGMWKIKVKETALETAEVLEEVSQTICLSKEDLINISKQKMTDDLLISKSFSCSTLAKRTSNTDSIFSFSCTAIGKSGLELALKVNGAMSSQEDIRYIVTVSQLLEGSETKFHIKKERMATRIANCKK